MAEINDRDSLKIIAFYLPQYHTIPENDAAWGKGFTEWTNVKKAEPLFDGHYQPKVPLNKNYYNLLDSNVQEWQSNLAQKYGIFGFCYYHYWFKNGKKLLEKPAERMLLNKNVSIPFCFCWANENWTRNWDGGNHEIIVEQDYGDVNDWEKHFQYFLPFFKDERYITYNNAPVLIVYKPELINDFKKMSDFFKKRCIESGFSGCEIIIQFPEYKYSPSYNEQSYDHYICFEPLYTDFERANADTSVTNKIKKNIKHILGNNMTYKLSKKFSANKKRELKKCSYDEQWECILSRKYDNEKFIAGAFVDWDNTARNKNGKLYLGASPEKFKNYFGELVNKINSGKQPKIIFINAWNEWGEGAYLEPDEKNGYAYLEAIRDLMGENNGN